MQEVDRVSGRNGEPDVPASLVLRKQHINITEACTPNRLMGIDWLFLNGKSPNVLAKRTLFHPRFVCHLYPWR